MQNAEQIWNLVDAKRDDFTALADRVWACRKPATRSTGPSRST